MYCGWVEGTSGINIFWTKELSQMSVINKIHSYTFFTCCDCFNLCITRPNLGLNCWIVSQVYKVFPKTIDRKTDDY